MAPTSASKTSSSMFSLVFHPLRMPLSSMRTHFSSPRRFEISQSVLPLTSFVRALVKNPSCSAGNFSKRYLVMINPRTESPINSSVSYEPSRPLYFLRADLCVKDLRYILISLIFVPTRRSSATRSMFGASTSSGDSTVSITLYSLFVFKSCCPRGDSPRVRLKT